MGGFINNKDSSANLLEKIQKRGKIIVGTQVPYPPFENINLTTGQLEGIDIEIIKAIAEKLGVTVQFNPMDFDPLFAAVQTNQIDVAISSITITAARDEVNDFSTPYYVANQAVLVRESSTISTLYDLNGTKIITQTGTTGQYWVEDNLVATGAISASQHTKFSDVPAAVLTVENNQQDAFIVDTPVAWKYANDTNYNLKVAFIIFTLEEYGILLPSEEPELKAAVDAALAELLADGTIEEIINRWMV
ncbi:MAG TPA: ABC transporter substrate-binding protein [Methanomassiliicoccales archaeon]|nr:ABC transporter substrate-binding protein [Methanomassiliicoccales archaeon]